VGRPSWLVHAGGNTRCCQDKPTMSALFHGWPREGPTGRLTPDAWQALITGELLTAPAYAHGRRSRSARGTMRDASTRGPTHRSSSP
jgi:hypothetical protein